MGAKLKALWAKLNADISEVWKDDKVFVFIFGAIMLVIKFRNILMDLIVSNSQSIFKSAQKESSVDQQQENKDNAAATKLEQDAQKLSSSETPVTDDWNKK
jgi:hypothetical protein